MKLTIFSKNKCNSGCETSEYLKKENYLEEYSTAADKARILKNLGLSDNIKHNYLIVDTKKDLNLLDNISEGTLVYVKNDSVDLNYFYQYLNGAWKVADFVDKYYKFGIPIYTPTIEQNYAGHLPDLYIRINTETDLDGFIQDKTYTTSKNGTYVDVLFSSLRALLAEVNKLKNSFVYGINSYTGTNTAINYTANNYSEIEEPLWAIEEDQVSELFSLKEASQLTNNTNNITINNGLFHINDTLEWKNSLTNILDDTKIIVYLTTDNLNITLKLIDDNENIINLDLGGIIVPNCKLYNVLYVISRRSENIGSNFIWVRITNAYTSRLLIEGYYNMDNVLKSAYYLDNAYKIESILFTDISIKKFKICAKYQDFSSEIIPSTPDDSDYKYKVAHITIRSVKDLNELKSIKSLLADNELILIEEDNSDRGLYIKNNNLILLISKAIAIL